MRIGIIGGGQLGLMMAEAAHLLGHHVIGLDPTPDCPLHHEADDMIVAPYDDEIAFERLVVKSDVLTYEFENVDLTLVHRFEHMIPQKSRGLILSKHRVREKEFARYLRIPTPRFGFAKTKADLFVPSIIKTTMGGYDGKGQHRLVAESDIDHFSFDGNIEYIIEELIDFDYEISVIATRDRFGHVVTYPIPINEHRDGILHISKIAGDIRSEAYQNAVDYTVRIITNLDYVGTLAVEYFVRGDEVLFNEFAPRPHNSGHYSIEGCDVSQFRNHIRAITGDEVLSPRLKSPTAMINVIGKNVAYYKRSNGYSCHIHDYRKNELRQDRKMGHITYLAPTPEDLDVWISAVVEDRS
mgnify:FL=1